MADLKKWGLEHKMYGLLLSLMLSLVFLSGCTETAKDNAIVKYQCPNGQLADSLDLCSQQKCAELNCSSCPPKVEYQEKIVEKTVEVIKYQCYGGTFEIVKSKCRSPEEVKFDNLDDGMHANITIQRVQVQLANLYPTRVTVENTGKLSLTPKFDVVVKKESKTVCSGSPIFDGFSKIAPGESKTGEFTIMGCMFEEDGTYTITIDVLDSDYNKLDSDNESFEVDYWGKFS